MFPLEVILQGMYTLTIHSASYKLVPANKKLVSFVLDKQCAQLHSANGFLHSPLVLACKFPGSAER